jgi:uncharacterized protein
MDTGRLKFSIETGSIVSDVINDAAHLEKKACLPGGVCIPRPLFEAFPRRAARGRGPLVITPASPGRPLRRAEREVSAPAEIDAILDEAPVLYVAFRDEPAPYVIPLCFGRVDRTLYVHAALTGTKLDLLARAPIVGFSAATTMTVVKGASACAWGGRARSVSGSATGRIVTDPAERRAGLDAIMRHYGSEDPAPLYDAPVLGRTCILAFAIDSLRAKRTG